MNKRVNFNLPGQAHELTFSCYRNHPFLAKPEYCQFLADAIVEAIQRHAFRLWAYVFMPDHVHLLIYPTSDNYEISEILQSIKQPVARRVLNKARKSGKHTLGRFSTGTAHRPYRFWQAGGGYDRNIISRAALMKAIDYIHNNPVKAGLVSSGEESRWSSISDWSGSGCGPLGLDREGIPSS